MKIKQIFILFSTVFLLNVTQISYGAEVKISMDSIREIVINNNDQLKISKNNYKSKKEYYDEIDDEIDDIKKKINTIKDDETKTTDLENYKSKLSSLNDIMDGKDDELKKLKLQYEDQVESLVFSAQQEYINYLKYSSDYELRKEELDYNEKINSVQQIKYDMGYISKNALNKNLVDVGDIRIECFNKKTNKEMRERELRRILGINDEKIIINEDVNYDLKKIEEIKVYNDLSGLINNSNTVKIKKMELNKIEDDDNANKYDEDNAEIELELSRKDVETTFKQKYYNLINSHNEMRNQINKLTNAENSFNVSRVKFQNGYMSSKDYKNEQINLLKAKKEYIDKKSDLYIDYLSYLKITEGFSVEGSGVSEVN